MRWDVAARHQGYCWQVLIIIEDTQAPPDGIEKQRQDAKTKPLGNRDIESQVSAKNECRYTPCREDER